ncbi:MAG: hypothetical protein JWP27_1471 [Flaviaesturariibacter sp.]|nr:hypothetical protein [Flaviaesturariibacter sp.]
MKAFILSLAVLASSITALADSPDVSEKVLHVFNNTFRDVTNVSWSSSARSYEASFELNQIPTRVSYDHEGNVLQTIRYYDGSRLPIVVLTKVTAKYADKKIFGVTELTSGDETTYHIILEDASSWVNIRSDAAGHLEIEKKLRKS